MSTPTRPDHRRWSHASHQNRSRQTEARILQAAFALVAKKPWEEISVADIARRAGISVGGFYARFPSKVALLRALDTALSDRAIDRIQRALAADRVADASVADVVALYIGEVFEFLHENRAIMRWVTIRARTTEDAEFLALIRAFNETTHDLLLGILLERSHEMTHPDPAAAAALGVTTVSAALREIVLFGDRRLSRTGARGRKLVRELTRLYCSYLGVTSVAPPSLQKGKKKKRPQ